MPSGSYHHFVIYVGEKKKQKRPFRVITRAAATSGDSADEGKSEATARRLSRCWRPKSQKKVAQLCWQWNQLFCVFFSFLGKQTTFVFVD